MSSTLRFGSLFAGIGGIDLGLERAGMTCAWQVEWDDYCMRVLEKHWPDIQKFGDVKDVGRHNLEPVDLIAGGFPCQPHSVAGKRRGAEDDRNLWPEFSRVIAELKPRYVLAENVPGIITTYLDTVLSDLESQDYTCATFNIPACAFDAPHRRERIFIVAYSSEIRCKRCNGISQGLECGVGRNAQRKSDAHGSFSPEDVADAERQRTGCWDVRGNRSLRNAERKMQGREGIETDVSGGWWTVEPNVGRVAHGVPARVDRLRALGNAVVPQVAEWIGRRIIEFDE